MTKRKKGPDPIQLPIQEKGRSVHQPVRASPYPGLESAGRPAIALGKVIMLQHIDTQPVHLTIKQLNSQGMSETKLGKVYSTLQIEHNISTREMEIRRHLASGKSSKEIGRQLFISPYTVDTHRRRLLKKTGAWSVVEMTRIAFSYNLL